MAYSQYLLALVGLVCILSLAYHPSRQNNEVRKLREELSSFRDAVTAVVNQSQQHRQFKQQLTDPPPTNTNNSAEPANSTETNAPATSPVPVVPPTVFSIDANTVDVPNVGKINGFTMYADTISNTTLEGTEEGLWYECRMEHSDDQSIAMCHVTNIKASLYAITSDQVPRSGNYKVTLTLSYKGTRAGYPTKNITPFEGKVFKNIASFNIEKTISDCVPHYKVAPPHHTDAYLWESCKPEPTILLDECAMKGNIIIMGDSHGWAWFNALANIKKKPVLASDESSSYQTPVTRIPNQAFMKTESLHFTEKGPSSRIPAHQRVQDTHTKHQVDQTIALLKNTVAQPNSVHNIVVMNFGHWDLRDITHAQFCARLEVFLAYLDEKGMFNPQFMSQMNVTYVWRTTPSYSYNRIGSSYPYTMTDRRTNQAIQASNTCAQHLLSFYPVKIHDTFGYVYPAFRETCDTHHYLCGVSPQMIALSKTYNPRSCFPKVRPEDAPYSMGCTGSVDLTSFLYEHVCPAQ
eukprot:TRINITY_DN33879_c0_g1_i1.p1 TRINITY_DN33879_c0_g1~~TRINITY_DN33879_c0_g1_i1.p1  ORF type:complete len:537 (+),score=64.38 TRINITY_DN33879_c0_g1_i1:57-1613(+)